MRPTTRQTKLLLLVALLATLLPVAVAGAETLTLNSLLQARTSGLREAEIVQMIEDRSNRVDLSFEDLATLRSAGMSSDVLDAARERIRSQEPYTATDRGRSAGVDPRLDNLVRMIDSGVSDQIVAEQIRRSGERYELSPDDVVYLKSHGASDTVIEVLLATADASAAGAPPILARPLEIDGLIINKGLFGNNQPGSLVLHRDRIEWHDEHKRKRDFSFETSGLREVWLTCEARTPENFCYQINFKIVKGDRYRFFDAGRDSGSNDAVEAVMEALRKYFPTLAYAAPEVEG